jgi:hypothetical protein
VVIIGESKGGVTAQEVDSSDIQAISDELILELTKIGEEIEALYDFPQDIEWAYLPSPSGREIGGEGDLHILQSRPITSLYPLPENLPPEPLKALIGLHVIQGVLEPFTPLGQTAIMHVLTGGGRAFGLDLTVRQQTAFYVAGERVWINVTPIVRHPRGHKAYPSVIKNIDPGIAQAFEEILLDPHLAPQPGSLHLLKLWRVIGFVLPNLWRVLRFLRHPEEMARQTLSDFDALVKTFLAGLSCSWMPKTCFLISSFPKVLWPWLLE